MHKAEAPSLDSRLTYMRRKAEAAGLIYLRHKAEAAGLIYLRHKAEAVS